LSVALERRETCLHYNNEERVCIEHGHTMDERAWCSDYEEPMTDQSDATVATCKTCTHRTALGVFRLCALDDTPAPKNRHCKRYERVPLEGNETCDR
jgi:hypothetical protein